MHAKRSEEQMRGRLLDLAEKIGCVPIFGGKLRLSRDLENRWWLCGCVGGSRVLPPARPEPDADKALDMAEAWLREERRIDE
jgi:hypothetical protein